MADGIQIKTPTLGRDFRAKLGKRRERIADAARFTLDEARGRILAAGRADIAAGGNFGSSRWQDGLDGVIEPEGVRTSDLTLKIFHRVPYAGVFEYGAVINGKPLLWIPLPWNPRKVRARDSGVRMFRVNRQGGKNPLLLSYDTKRPLYVGVKSVKLRRRWHLRPIFRGVAQQVPALFAQSLKRI